MKGAAALGALLVLGHAALLWPLGERTGAPLEVTCAAPPASPTLHLEGEVPAALADRVHAALDDLPRESPGLRRMRWRARYRGGHERAVGVTQLVGPFQDPAAPPCSGSVVLGQALFDDGAASPGTLAHLVRAQLERELAGAGAFPVGDFRGIAALTIRLAEAAHHPEDRELFEGEPPAGYLRITAELDFERVRAPVVLALEPYASEGEIELRIAARASLAFENRLAQWLSDHLGGDLLASALTRRQLAQTLRATLGPPPPLPLPGGGELRFSPCGAPQLREGSHAVWPFAIALAPLPGLPHHLPPALPAPLASAHELSAGLDAAHPLALELPLDALNALLYGAWRHGLLDRELARAGLVERFEADPLVATYLSLRLGAPRLTLPPVVTASRAGLRLSAESELELRDGDTRTPARVWTTLTMIAPTTIELPDSAADTLRTELAELELTCQVRPHVLAPCYADLVAAARGRAADFAEPLTAALARLVAELFARRSLGSPELPGQLYVHSARPSVRLGATSHDGVVRLTFRAELRDAAR